MCGDSPADCLNCTRPVCIYDTQQKPSPKPATKKQAARSKASRAYIKRYRKAHPEKVREWRQNFNRSHPDYEAKYRAANKEKRAEYNRKYRQAHKAQAAAADSRAYPKDPQKQRDRTKATWKRNQRNPAGQGALIRRSRLNNGLTQAALADLLYMSRGAISVWETDRAPANWSRLATVFPEYEDFEFIGGNKDA